MADPETPTRKPRLIWRIVLVVSLALNLAVAGLVIGVVSSGQLANGPPRSIDLGLGPIVRALTEEERRSIARALRQNRDLLNASQSNAAGEVLTALRAVPFDAAAFRATLAARREQGHTLQARAEDAFIGVISNMDDSRRAAFADVLEQEMSKPRRPRPPREGSPE